MKSTQAEALHDAARQDDERAMRILETAFLMSHRDREFAPKPAPPKSVEYVRGGWSDTGGGIGWGAWVILTVIIAILSAALGFLYGRYF